MGCDSLPTKPGADFDRVVIHRYLKGAEGGPTSGTVIVFKKETIGWLAKALRAREEWVSGDDDDFNFKPSGKVEFYDRGRLQVTIYFGLGLFRKAGVPDRDFALPKDFDQRIDDLLINPAKAAASDKEE